MNDQPIHPSEAANAPPTKSRRSRKKKTPEQVDQAIVAPTQASEAVEPTIQPTRPRGRPVGKRPDMPYQRLLVSQSILDSIRRLGQQSTLTEEQIFNQVDEMMANPEANMYYFRLVYSMAYTQYSQLQELNIENAPDSSELIYDKTPTSGKSKPKRKKVTIKSLSEQSNLEYFNFIRLFKGKGKGNGHTVFQFILFMRRHKINFVELMFDPGIVEKAYLYYSILKEGKMDQFIRDRLFE